MDPIGTFWCDPTGKVIRSLRRFVFSSDKECSGGSYHNASVSIGQFSERKSLEGYLEVIPPSEYADNEMWPQRCEHCSYIFQDDDQWQVSQKPLYVSVDRGEWMEADLPAGAMYEAWWNPHKGPDGMCLVVVVPPGGNISDHWYVDMQASNCTRPGEDHYCWCRTGNPRLEPVNVSKDCDTCSAGAGSIQTSRWHGFLRDGFLV